MESSTTKKGKFGSLVAKAATANLVLVNDGGYFFKIDERHNLFAGKNLKEVEHHIDNTILLNSLKAEYKYLNILDTALLTGLGRLTADEVRSRFMACLANR